MYPATLVVIIYGVFTLVGGVIGYVKAKSKASLMAGVASGLFLLFCAAGVEQGSRPAVIGTLVVALSLGVRFAGTWWQKRRVMPDLLMVVLSVATLVVVGRTLLQ